MDEKIKILIVDDDIEDLIQVKSLIKNRANCKILEASRGSEALNVIEEQKPHIVLYDVLIHDINGARFCDMVKSEPETEAIPIVLLTEAGKEREIHVCSQTSCDDCIAKPVNRMDLLNKLNQYTGLPIREYIRSQINGKVTTLLDGKEHTGYLANISEDGFNIRSSEPFPKGDILNMKMILPRIAEEVAIRGKVIWSSSPDDLFSAPADDSLEGNLNYEYGFQFVELPGELKEAIIAL